MAKRIQSGSLVPADGVALVTGASRGIGRAIAIKLAATGRPVGLIARSDDALEAVASEARKLGPAAEPVPCDMAHPAEIIAAIKRVTRAIGPIRVLVNNAGTFLDKPMHETTVEQWQHVLQVNLTAAFVATKAVWPMMVDRGGGIIVNIASKAGTQGYLGQSAYGASKAGMLGWARVVAMEGRPHRIRVHNICPGGVDTELIAGTPLADRLKDQVMMQPDDVADVACFCIAQPENVDLPDLLMSRFAP